MWPSAPRRASTNESVAAGRKQICAPVTGFRRFSSEQVSAVTSRPSGDEPTQRRLWEADAG